MVMLGDARVDDAAEIYSITRAWSALPGHLVTAPDEVSVDRIAADIPAIRNAGRIVVALDGDAVTGFALLRAMELEAISHVYRLTVAVRPGNVGRGIGSALLEALIAWASGTPAVRKIELLVRATNRTAIRLYSKFGFQEEGRLKNRVRIPGKEFAFVDDISMAWFPEGGPPTLQDEVC